MARYRRNPGWQQALPRFLDDIRFRPFDWAVHNCGFVIADWVLIMTGQDPAAEYRGRFRTAAGAARCMKRIAGGGVVETATRAFGIPQASPMLARRGDVVAARIEETPDADFALGIVGPDGVTIHLATEFGTAAWPLKRADFAWHVG